MTAKEMFEKLGYKCQEDDFSIEFIKQMKCPLNNKKVEYVIEFYKDIKTFSCEALSNNKEHYTNDIDMKELQAINKQVEELGWNK